MTAANFDACMPLLKANEGGFTANPDDPGNWTGGAKGKGELRGTNFGISAASYPTLDIRNLTWPQAVEIYRRDYWTPAGCDMLPDGVDWCVLDAAVNSGVHASIQWLQTAVGTTADGVIGPQTKQAIANAAPVVTIGKICDARLAFLQRLGTWPEFGAGWTARVSRVRGDALRMAQAPQPVSAQKPAQSDPQNALSVASDPQPLGWIGWVKKQVGL